MVSRVAKIGITGTLTTETLTSETLNRIVTNMAALLCSAIALVSLNACSAQSTTKPATAMPVTKAVLATLTAPALYSGNLPCADCQGLSYEIDLRPRGIFFLRTTYLGKSAANTVNAGKSSTTHHEFGKWSVTENTLLLSFLSGAHRQESFLIKENGTLRKLDSAGKEIVSSHSYDLANKPYSPIEPTLRLTGMYQYQADAAMFTECLTGISVPVAEEGDNSNLQRAYSVARKEPGRSVYVELEGRIALRNAAEGGNKLNTLVVDKAGNFFPLKKCESSQVSYDLESTRWVPVILNGLAVILQPQQREPFIVLDPKELRVSGLGGCNRIVGSYTVSANAIKLSKMAMTMMACDVGMDTEQQLSKAFEATVTWRITGDQLEFLNAENVVVAKFAARNL
jgi:copper homeostasis protein (lipoprotein)